MGAKRIVKEQARVDKRLAAAQEWSSALQLPPRIKSCPACGALVEKVGDSDQVMCRCEAQAAGGTYEKALRSGGCGHQFDLGTLAPTGVGRPGNPANAKQVLFFLGDLDGEEGLGRAAAAPSRERLPQVSETILMVRTIPSVVYRFGQIIWSDRDVKVDKRHYWLRVDSKTLDAARGGRLFQLPHRLSGPWTSS